MAIEILRTCVGHDVRHDLESFFWLLIWVVLRHTAHSQRSDPQMFMDLFGSCTEKDSAGAKWVFLGASQPDWKVPGNEPLSTLITKFKVLVANQNPLIGADNSPDPIYLTYESVVALFDEALTKTTWPVGDKALPFSLPKDKKSSRSDRGERVIGSKRVRDDAEDDDPISMLQPALKKAQVFSPLRNEVGGADKDDEAGGAVSPSTPRSPSVPPGNF